MDIQEEIDVFLSKQPKEIVRIFSLIEFCESLNIFRFKKSNTKLDLGVDLHILNYGWSMWQAAKAQSAPENKQFNLDEFLTMEEKLKHKGGVITADLDRFIAYAESVLIQAKALKEPK